MASNVWSQIKKQQEEEKKEQVRRENSVWAGIKSVGEEPATFVSPEAFKPVVVDNELPVGSISFDLESGSVDFMFSAGPEFIRLAGWSIDYSDVYVDTDCYAMIEDIMQHDGWIIGHNIMNFDNILLNRMCGVNILELAKKDRLVDTKLLAFLADPPYSRTKEGEIEKMFSLDNVGLKYLGEGKAKDAATGSSMLKELAKEFGGFDQIPQDDSRYVHYLRRDVEITRDLVRVLPMSDYTRREHRISAVASTISVQGFRVDVPLLEERIEQGEQKRLKILTKLEKDYGLPGPDTTKAPQMTKLGKLAIDTAFKDLGITLDRTASGQPGLGKEVLLGVVEAAGENQDVIDLAESVLSLNGIRTIYGNIHEYLVGDRVHPSINLRQSTGRWSIQKPGLTVIGKRGGKVIERAVFLPDQDDHVLISADLAQVDARAVAALSQDREYMKLFEGERDAHTEMAIRIYGSADFRERVKACVHGVNYGMRSKKLAWTTGLSLYEADEFIANFEQSFPRLAQWQYEMRQIGESIGILYNGFGRMMRIESDRAFTQSPALMGQSTARDILMEGMLRLWDIGGEDVIRMIRAVVHDELVMSVPVRDVVEIEKLVVKAMSFEWCPVNGEYPIQIDSGLNKRGTNWAKAYDKDTFMMNVGGIEICNSHKGME